MDDSVAVCTSRKSEGMLFTCGFPSGRTSLTFKPTHRSRPEQREFMFRYLSPHIATRTSRPSGNGSIPLNQATEVQSALQVHYLDCETSDMILNMVVSSLVKVNSGVVFVFTVAL